MDQDNSKGQDKRNWRERLGIGAQGQKDLPKISDDFKKPAPAAAATPARPVGTAKPAPRPTASAVKPAPMAPRANPKPAAPVAPDKLAERLRTQREASTKLAEQRVQVARQRAVEAPPAAPQPPVQATVPAAKPSGPKPKFTFAEEGAAPTPAAKPAVPVVKSVGAPPPPMQPTLQPQLAPARPPLGGFTQPPQQQPPFVQRPPIPQPPAYQPMQPPPGYMNGYQPQPVPPYRPVDPATGFAPPPGYVSQQRGFGAPPPQQQFNPQGAGPRLNLPPRPEMPRSPGLNPNLAPPSDYGAAAAPQSGFALPPRPGARPPLRGPAAPPLSDDQENYGEEFYDEMPAPTRAARPTRDDYNAAYREAEYGFEEEPKSRTPLLLIMLMVLTAALVTGGIIGYRYLKPTLFGQTATQDAPLVEPPSTPVKAEAEQPAAQTRSVGTPTKKQIYDRIVGDEEQLGGDVAPPAEVPAAIPEPAQSGAAPLEAAPETQQPGSGTTDDAAPLPIPPPPGGTDGQQGALDPVSTEKQSAENISPAAGESQAAVASNDVVAPIEDEQSASRSLALPPAPGEQVTETAPVADDPPAQEAVVDSEPVVKKPDTPKKVAVKKIEKPKVAEAKSLGAKPVVLVPPAKKPKIAKPKPALGTDAPAVETASADGDGGLYGIDGGTPAPVEPVKPAAAPKKKTLADLFGNSQPEAPAAPQPDVEVASIDTKPKATLFQQKKPEAPKPVEQASGGGGFVAQLASFRSRDEATREFTRLKAKHPGTLGRFSPVISEATVGGSTRFRLSVGSMPSKAQADAVCTSLIAKGEPDCLVKKF